MREICKFLSLAGLGIRHRQYTSLFHTQSRVLGTQKPRILVQHARDK